jgi:hypothetical protein
MDRDKLIKDLEELKLEIGSLDDNDPQVIDRLKKLTASIEEALESPADSARNEDLIQGIQHFELEHPNITGILDRITKALSSMGI